MGCPAPENRGICDLSGRSCDRAGNSGPIGRTAMSAPAAALNNVRPYHPTQSPGQTPVVGSYTAWVVRRRALPSVADAVRVLGIDDFAWKRGQRYGTLLCDLEQRRIIDLLSDREAGTVEAWLADHPEITIISRDRGGGYGQA